MPALYSQEHGVHGGDGSWQFTRAQGGTAHIRLTTQNGYFDGDYEVRYYNDSTNRVKKLTLISDSIIIDAAKDFYDFDRGNDWVW